MMINERDITERETATPTERADELRRAPQALPHHPPATQRDITRAEQPRFTRGTSTARAYRDGLLLCARVELIVRPDTRIGLAPRERRYLTVRFLDRLHPALRTDLVRLVRRRGAAARRIADTLEAIELVLDDPHRGRHHILVRLQPPQVRHGQLRNIEFGLRESEPTR